MTKKDTIEYVFYSLDNPEDEWSFMADEWTKEEMENEVIYYLFPYEKSCGRKKIVNGKLRYDNFFSLGVRRNNPNYLSPYKKQKLGII